MIVGLGEGNHFFLTGIDPWQPWALTGAVWGGAMVPVCVSLPVLKVLFKFFLR